MFSLAPNLRLDDIREAATLNLTPEQALLRGFVLSEDNVKAHLIDLAVINEKIDKNSRKTAMYYALLESSLFYQNCIIK